VKVTLSFHHNRPRTILRTTYTSYQHHLETINLSVMWRLRLLRRRNVVAAAVGTSAVASMDMLWKHKDENKEGLVSELQDSIHHNPMFSNMTTTLPLFTPSIQQCQCEPLHPTLTQQTRTAAALSRRATIRLLNETSNPIQNLHAKYKINWNLPLGEGTFGAVFSAINRKTSDKVALKKIPKKFTDSSSFLNEVNALLHVRTNGGHPYICSLKENFEDEKYYYMVLDLVSGGEMFEHLIKMGAYSEADASRLVKEVAAALTFMHGIGIVHGDLKPENLMLSTARSEDSTIKIVDFGCAQISEESGFIISKSSAGNTPAYCPPEVLENPDGPITPAMDVWGLGIILYIMLTGLHPFDLHGTFHFVQ